MTSKSVALLLADLGVTKTHSRPRVSNDNPFSESAFKTLKDRPGFLSASYISSRPAPTAARFSIGTTTSITTARSVSAPP
jgi:transposase InsO family protein